MRLKAAAGQAGGMAAELAKVQAEIAALKLSLGLAEQEAASRPIAAQHGPVDAEASYEEPCHPRWFVQCKALYEDGLFYRARVIDRLPGGRYLIEYIDYDELAEVSASEIRDASENDSLYQGPVDEVDAFDDPDELDYDEYGRPVKVAPSQRSHAGGSRAAKGVQRRGLSTDSYNRRHDAVTAADPTEAAAFGGDGLPAAA